MTPPTVLLTRPRTQSHRFADLLRARLGADLSVLIAPVQAIVPDPRAAAAALRGAGGVIFTSQSGVAACAGADVPPGLPAFCVGTRTADAARAAGFAPRPDPPGDLDGLVARIAADGWPRDAGPLVHLHGAHVTGDAMGALAALGIGARGHVVYDQRAMPLSDAARRLLAARARVVVPVFSPRSARLMAPALATATARVRIAAISPRAAAALDVQAARKVRVADSPDAAGMVDTVAALLSGWERLEP